MLSVLVLAIAFAGSPVALPSAVVDNKTVPVSPRGDTVFVGVEDMVRTAMLNNLSLLAAAEDFRAIQTYARSARSRFDPLLSLGGDSYSGDAGGQLTGRVPTGASYLLGSVSPSTLPGQPLYPNAIVASLSQPLLRGLGWQSSRPGIRAVDEGIDASRARLDRTRLEVAASIRVAYAQLVQRHRQEAIARRSVQRAEELRVAYADLRALGKITEVDLITAQLGVTSRRATLLEYQRDRRDAQDALVFSVYGTRAASMLGDGDRVLMPSDTSVVVPVLPSVDSAVAIALDARADVQAVRHEASRAHLQLQQARNSLLPSLDLTGALTSTRNDIVNGIRTDSREPRVQDWSLGIVFSRPLRNSAASAERVRADATESRAVFAVREMENGARAEVRAAYRNIALGREQVTLAGEASQLARKQYEGERERLNLGLTDLFRVLQYEEQVARIERAEADAWLSLAAAVAQYRLAVGAATVL